MTTGALALTAASAQAFTLNVLHFNDFHSRLDAINAFDSTCSDEDEAEGKCFGGAARLKTAIDTLRAEAEARGEPVLVLVAGDVFQGSLFFNTYSGLAEAEVLNAMGLDAMVYGNHEFDLGPEALAAFIEKAEFPVISGNVDISGDNRLAGLSEEYLVFEFGGEKVAVLGATTTDTPEIASPGPTVAFRDPAEYLTAKIAELQAEGIEKVILLGHLGAPLDLELAATVPGLDLVIGGHTNTLFSNTAENASYPYPEMVTGPDGSLVPVVQAGAHSRYLGHIALTFDDAGKVTAAEGDSMLLDAAVIPDEDVLAQVDALRGPIEEAMGEVVAQVAGDIDGSRENCRAVECQMGNLVADAMLDRVKGQGVTIALQNGGGLRASIAGGDVTKGDIVAVLPFQNTLATFQITGAGIVASLENGVSQVEDGAGRFPQVAGMKFTWNPSAPAGERVTEVLVAEGDAWVPIDPEKVYSVVTNDFVRMGGDGFATLRDDAVNAYDYGPGLEIVLIDYLVANPGYTPFTEGRISKVE
jgi:5'-nucleotidase